MTALFADIKGSMELMEDLDPEEARAIVDPALKLMMDAVHHYGGYVAQSTGDGIFAERPNQCWCGFIQGAFYLARASGRTAPQRVQDRLDNR